jgi:hypothetical protein
VKKIFALMLTATLVLGGCSVPQVIVEKAGNDLARTSALAKKYDKPEVAKCADFLLATLDKAKSEESKLQELLKEDTDGILSAALKAALIAELGKNVADSNKAQFEADFKTNCNAVAGDIMIKLLQDAGKVARKGN